MKQAALAVLIASTVVFCSLATPAVVRAEPQTVCPIMGGTIDKKVFADHDGKRVYFCCAGCITPFQKDPAKHIAKLESQGVVLDKTPAQPKKQQEAGHEGHNQ